MSVSVAPKLKKELDFKVKKEDWYIYELNDGSILKIRPVLIRVFETDAVNPQTGEPILALEGKNIVTVRSPEHLKGKPSKQLPPPSEALKMPKEEVEIKRVIHEPDWNLYELEGGKKLKSKLVVTNIYRIKSLYDRFGNPYYVVQSQTVWGSSPEYYGKGFPQLPIAEYEHDATISPMRPIFRQEIPDNFDASEVAEEYPTISEWFKVSQDITFEIISKLKEVYELPSEIPIKSILADVVRADEIVKQIAITVPREVREGKYITMDKFELDLSKIEREDIYYSFSLGDDLFLAKRVGNTVRVFEAYEVASNRILAIPIYEVELVGK